MSRDDPFLKRWSRLKRAAREATPEGEASPPPAGAQAPAEPPAVASPPPLPPVESLTPESDFSPFMRAEVDPSLKRAALKTLFRDPRYNVMDGLDVYIDDYSKPDPLPEGWLEKMNQVTHLGDAGADAEPDDEAPVNISRDDGSAAPPGPAEPAQEAVAAQAQPAAAPGADGDRDAASDSEDRATVEPPPKREHG